MSASQALNGCKIALFLARHSHTMHQHRANYCKFLLNVSANGEQIPTPAHRCLLRVVGAVTIKILYKKIVSCTLCVFRS